MYFKSSNFLRNKPGTLCYFHFFHCSRRQQKPDRNNPWSGGGGLFWLKVSKGTVHCGWRGIVEFTTVRLCDGAPWIFVDKLKRAWLEVRPAHNPQAILLLAYTHQLTFTFQRFQNSTTTRDQVFKHIILGQGDRHFIFKSWPMQNVASFASRS